MLLPGTVIAYKASNVSTYSYQFGQIEWTKQMFGAHHWYVGWAGGPIFMP